MSERHEKWQAVEPGTVIPAGQPFRIERPSHASEYLGRAVDSTVPSGGKWFTDSSWKPPLDLPTEAVSWREIPGDYEVGDGERVRCEFNDARDEAVELTASEDMAGAAVRHLFRGWAPGRRYYTVGVNR